MVPDTWPETLPLPARDTVSAPQPLASALWTLRPDPRGGPTVEALRPHLSPNEWARVSTFRDPAHAWSSAAARAVLRVMLARFHGGRPLDWHFRTEPGGRPHVDMTRPPFPLTEATRPRFSLSHTRGLAACLVSVGSWPPGAELGVDAEWTGRRVPARRLAERFFHPDEARALAARPDELARQDLFMVLWTRKEAALKALGLGIANHLRDIACLGEPATVTGPAGLVGAAEAWRMGGERITADHRLSWALRGPEPDPGRARVVLAAPAPRHVIGWPP